MPAQWLRERNRRRIYLAHGRPLNLRTGQREFVFISSDPAEGYEVRMKGDFSIARELPQTLVGPASFDVSPMDIDNADDQISHWMDWSWSGAEFTVLIAQPRDIGGASAVFAGYSERLVWLNDSTLRLEFREYSVLENVDVFPQQAGQPVERIPRSYGHCRDVTLRLVDEPLLKYSTGLPDMVSIEQVSIRGIEQFFDEQDYATEAELDAATVFPGNYATSEAAGLVRLGSQPDGLVTATVQGPPKIAEPTNRAAWILRTMGMQDEPAGGGVWRYPHVNFSDSQLDVLEADAPYDLGLHLDGARNVLDATDEVLNSIGAVRWRGGDGFVYVDVLRAPAKNDPVRGEIDESDIIGDLYVEPVPPVWRVEITWGKIWTTQTSVPSDVDETRQEELRRGYVGRVTWDDATLLANNAGATVLQIDGLFRFEANALSEAQRRLSLYQEQRFFWSMRVWNRCGGFEPNDLWQLTFPRLTQPDFRTLRVVAVTDFFLQGFTDVVLWG